MVELSTVFAVNGHNPPVWSIWPESCESWCGPRTLTLTTGLPYRGLIDNRLVVLDVLSTVLMDLLASAWAPKLRRLNRCSQAINPMLGCRCSMAPIVCCEKAFSLYAPWALDFTELRGRLFKAHSWTSICFWHVEKRKAVYTV